MLQIGLVYFFSGLAKIEADWLSGTTLEIIGNRADTGGWMSGLSMSTYQIMAIGTIVIEVLAFPFLLWNKTRTATAILLISFHLLNYMSFTIGLFSWLMIASTSLFLPKFCKNVAHRFFPKTNSEQQAATGNSFSKGILVILAIFFTFQIFLPLRHHLIPGKREWSEGGFLFSWNMFLSNKIGATQATVIDRESGQKIVYGPADLGINWAQENKLYRNPAMLLQFAHAAGEDAQKRGMKGIEVYIDAQMGLNGRRPQAYVHPNADIFKENFHFWGQYDWVWEEKDPRTPQNR